MTREQKVQRLLEQISCVLRLMKRQAHHERGHLKLTRPYIDILFLLSRSKNGLTTKELADKLQVTSGAISQFIDELVQKKLVNRVEDESDRRTQIVSITTHATDTFKKFRQQYFTAVAPLFDQLSDPELTQMADLLDKITPKQSVDNEDCETTEEKE